MKEKKLIKKYLEYAQDIILDDRYLELKKYIQHGTTSVYEHSICVSFACFKKAYGNKKYDLASLVKATLLHDYFLYDWHSPREESGRKGLHGYTHPRVASTKAEEHFLISKKEKQIIESHMWPLTLFHFPRSREGWLLCRIDKKVSLDETFKKEVEDFIILFKEINKLMEAK